jgi:hypothetical protein
MKKNLIFIILIVLSISAFADSTISLEQNMLNREYLVEVDKNITFTLDLLTAFNNTLNKMPEYIEGSRLFSKFLMEMTMECSGMRDSIKESLTVNAGERDLLLQILIANLNPGVELFSSEINEEQNSNNEEEIVAIQKTMKFAVIELQKKIIVQEKGIVESETFNKYFFNLHTQHLMFQLSLNFVEPSEKLSSENRFYLLQVIREIQKISAESMMPQEKE